MSSRDLYRATSALTRGLEFWSFMGRAIPFCGLVWQAKDPEDLCFLGCKGNFIQIDSWHEQGSVRTLQVYGCIYIYSFYIFINTFMNITNLRFLIKLTLLMHLISCSICIFNECFKTKIISQIKYYLIFCFLLYFK